MGIPFPASQVRVPEAPPNPLEQYAQVLGIKGMLQQQQMRQMAVEQAKREQADQVAIREILSDPTIDWGKPYVALQTITQRAAGKVSPETLMKIRGNLAKDAKDFADMDYAEQQRRRANNGELYQYATAIMSQATPEEEANLYARIRTGLIMRGDPIGKTLPEQYPGKAEIAAIRGSLGLTDAMWALTQNAPENKAKLEKAQAEAIMAGQEAAVSPEFLKREAAKHPERKLTPGTDIPYSPEVLEQKRQLAREGSARIEARMERSDERRNETDAKKRIRNRVDTYRDAERRLGIMEHAIQNPNPQNDVALLFNHIGMTLSAQKGARITNAEIHRAISARSLPSDLQAAWQRVQSGQFLTPQQRTEMVNLARHGVEQSRNDALNEASDFGIDIRNVAPGLDRRNGGGGIKIIRDANGRIAGIE